MGERSVCLGHPVGIFPFFESRAFFLISKQQLFRKADGHGQTLAGTRRVKNPAHGKRCAARRPHFYGHLVIGPADAPRFYF